MIIRPTERWMHGVVVPNLGICYPPRATEAYATDEVAAWLIENGFAAPVNAEAATLPSDVPPDVNSGEAAEQPKPKRSPSPKNPPPESSGDEQL